MLKLAIGIMVLTWSEKALIKEVDAMEDGESRQLWDDFKRSDDRKAGCRLCENQGCPEFLEMIDCITGKFNIERINYCPRCGRKLE